VGVSDYFYAEIQDGLNQGEVVSLEMPKEEREKKPHQLATQKTGEATPATAKPAAAPGGVRTNSATAGTGSQTGSPAAGAGGRT
jgi:hypothetical protein